MTNKEAIELRHSVRHYTDKPIPSNIITLLSEEISQCNSEGNLNIQLVVNNSKAFDNMLAHYGNFSGVQNYIALIGKKGEKLDELIGYYGERIAIKAQTLGLNTCWVAVSFNKNEAKKNCNISKDEKLVCVLSLGYGSTSGKPHISKPVEKISKSYSGAPQQFIDGVKAAMLAPTAVNQQKFTVELMGNSVKIQNLGGFYSEVDFGIVKYHFEVGSDNSFNIE